MFPSKEFSYATLSVASKPHWLWHNSKMTQQNRGHPEREGYRERSFHSKLPSVSPPFESMWVRKDERETEKGGRSEQESKKKKFSILSYLQHFQKDSGASTWKNMHQSFPADFGHLCSPHEAQDFSLCLPMTQQSQLSTNHAQTLPGLQGKNENGFNKTVSNTLGHPFSCVCSWVEQSLDLWNNECEKRELAISN